MHDTPSTTGHAGTLPPVPTAPRREHVTEQPLPKTLPNLMRGAGLTYRALAQRTRHADPTGQGLSHGHLANLTRGEHPSARALDLLAAAFDLAPAYFPEHRLAQLRHDLDERRVGFTAAYQRYATLTAA